MQTNTPDEATNREEAASVIAAALIAEYGEKAAIVAQSQIGATDGDVKVSWEIIAEAIWKLGHPEAL